MHHETKLINIVKRAIHRSRGNSHDVWFAEIANYSVVSELAHQLRRLLSDPQRQLRTSLVRIARCDYRAKFLRNRVQQKFHIASEQNTFLANGCHARFIEQLE